MRALKHISLILIAGVFLFATPWGRLSAQGYDGTKLTKIDHKFTIGFERHVATIYKPASFTVSKKTRQKEEHCNRMIFRMQLTSRFKMETGLSYKAIDRILNSNGAKDNKCQDFGGQCKLSVPLTIQYQLQNERYRLRPYFGAGVQYMSLDMNSINEASTLFDGGISNRLKYINIIFTQGLIYDVTPDLQITQSIHILPENGIKPVGINFGIGYRIK